MCAQVFSGHEILCMAIFKTLVWNMHYSDIKCCMLTECSGDRLSCDYVVVTCDIERYQTYILYIIDLYIITCTCIYWNAIFKFL